MQAHSPFLRFSRYLPLVLVALPALALGGCNELAAEKAEPARPVLTATVHYEAEIPDRSFVGTIKPRGVSTAMPRWTWRN